MNIGLTGGIASGKSTVAALLAQHGAALIDLDRIAREVVLPGSPVLKQIVDRFGSDMLQEDGSLHRKRLGEIVFRSAADREALNAITHPAIRQIMFQQMAAYEEEDPNRLIVVDVPLLYESKMEHLFEEVMVVYVPRQLQLKRLMERDGITEEQAEARLNAQLDIEAKRAQADIVIWNDQGIEETKEQVLRFVKKKGML